MAKLYPVLTLSFIVGPVMTETADNGQTILTHLQKYSRLGFLFTWPFCFHIWLTFKYQGQDSTGGWKPGTERVLYARTPGYRWDADLGMKTTRGYFGLHWD